MNLKLITLSICIMLMAAQFPSTIQAKVSKNQYLVLSGKIVKRDEIWDRRTNKQMGRPDFLKAIHLQVEVIEVRSGSLPDGSRSVTAVITERALILKAKKLKPGDIALFTLKGTENPYAVLGLEALNTESSDKYSADKVLQSWEKANGWEIKASKALQQKAVSEIAAKFKLENAEYISLVSFSGPMPPEKGYLYWGVRGQIKGVWHVWQRGMGGGLKAGRVLENPNRYKKCNSMLTMISTPSGSVPIYIIRAGDIVYTDGMRAVRVLKLNKVRADHHTVCRLRLNDGTVLEISPGHPLSDRRLFSALKPGDTLDGRTVLKVELIPYAYDYTYDLLPNSPTGNYYANGVLVGSTLMLTDE